MKHNFATPTFIVSALLMATGIFFLFSCSKKDKVSVLPTITSFAPAGGISGIPVIITGTNFDASAVGNTVTFNGVKAAIVSASSTSLTVTVPVGAGPGKIAVGVNGKIDSSADDFQYMLTVTTLAGTNGSGGFVDATGTNARFNIPTGIAVDASGTIYVADYMGNRIRKITPAGVVTTLAGDGNKGLKDTLELYAQFYQPSGVAVDPSGNVFVADGYNNRIRKITPAGVVTTFAGGGGLQGSLADGQGTLARFSGPRGIAIDAAGNIYIADVSNSAIRKITPAGLVTTLAGGAYGFTNGTGSVAQFGDPIGVAVDAAGNVYVADYGNHSIRKVTPAGVVTTLAGNGSPGTADGAGALAQFSSPTGVAVDAAGNIFVSERDSHRIRKITPAGLVTTVAGAPGGGYADGAANVALFSGLQDIALTPAGIIYVTDETGTVRKLQ